MTKSLLTKKTLLILNLFIILFTFAGCNRDDSDSGSSADSGYFNITKTGGQTMKTAYDPTVQQPSKSGTFAVQYQSGERLDFFGMVDSNSDFYLSLYTYDPIKLNTPYISTRNSGALVSFGATLNNENIYWSKFQLVFTSATIPGKIAGNYTAYDSSNNILVSGNFDFVKK